MRKLIPLFIIPLFFAMVLTPAWTLGGSVQSPEYVGSEACAPCHEENYAGWNQTMHAQAYSDPIFQKVWEADGKPSYCLRCHTTGYSAETETYALEGVTCEQCHGAGMEMTKTVSAELCGSCHEGSHHPTFSEWEESKHAASLPDLQAMGQDKNARCMPCRTTQGFLAKLKGETVSPEEATDTITCAACHDPHSAEHEHQLRLEPASELCGACHTGGTTLLHHPQYEYWKGGSHALANVGCESCHMYKLPYVSEEEPAATGHTFEIVKDAEGKPLTCGNCHGVIEGILSYGAAVEELTEIHEWFEEEAVSLSTLIEDATTAFEDANSTLYSFIKAGVSKETLDDAFKTLDASIGLVEEAENAYHSVEADASDGFHNPKFYTEKLTEARVMAHNAVDLSAAAKKLGEALAGIDKAIQEATTDLQADLKKAEADLKEAEAKLKETQDKLATSEENLAKTKTDLAKSEADKKEAIKKLSDAQASVTTLQTKVTELEGRVAELEAAVVPPTTLYLYLGVGLVIGIIVGAGIVYAARRKKT